MDGSIAFYRKKQNISQQELADAIGISRTHLSYIENKRFYPDHKIAERISELLNVTIGQIYTREELEFILYKDNYAKV